MRNIIEEFLNKRGEILCCLCPESKAYNNVVYKIISNKRCYIFKQYVNMKRENELKILKFVSTPKLYESQSDYRIEEFISHEVPDLRKDTLLLVSAMVRFHSMKVPGIETFQNVLVNLIVENQNVRESVEIDRIYRKMEPLFEDHSMDGLLHMDLHTGNMLKAGKEIILVDFEFSCSGNIAIDIANMFCESMADEKADGHLAECQGLDELEKRRFVEEYACQSKEATLTTDVLYARVEEMQCLSHFFWFLFCRKYAFQGCIDSDAFDYVKYSLNRLLFLEKCGFKEDLFYLREELENLIKNR